MIANYDKKPNVFSKTQKTITYRWDIIQETNKENVIKRTDRFGLE